MTLDGAVRRGALCLSLLLVLLVGASTVAAGAELVVDDGSDCPDAGYSSIQNAIDSASAGDTITVCSGTYSEALDVPAGTDSLRIVGQGRPVIDNDGTDYGIDIQASGVVVDGLDVRSGGTAIYVAAADARVRNNTVTSDEYGVRIHQSRNVTLEGNTVSNAGLAGIYLSADSTAAVRANTVTRNPIGVDVASGAWVAGISIHRNGITGNEDWGVRNANASSVDATANWWGATSGPSGSGPGTGDAVSSNVVVAPWAGEAIPDRTVPAVESAVEYDGGRIEVTFSEPVRSLSASDVTVYLDGEPVGATIASGDGTAGRIVLSAGTDVKPVDRLRVDFGTLTDSVGNSADPDNVTATPTGDTVEVASAGSTNGLTTYQGTPVAIDFGAHWPVDQPYERFAGGEFRFAGSAGVFSQVVVFDTDERNRSLTHQFDADADGDYEATIELRDLGLSVSARDSSTPSESPAPTATRTPTPTPTATPTPEPTPTATPGPTPTPGSGAPETPPATPSATPTATQTPASTPAPTTTRKTPGFGIAVAAIALLAAALLASRREA